MYQYTCEFCENSIEAEDIGAVQQQATTHLEDNHYANFAYVFQEKFGGKECLNGCGYTFPLNPETDVGFDCPSCGHDNFPEFANRHVWWRAEVVD